MGIYMGTRHTITRRINYLYRCSSCGQATAQSAFVFGSAVYDGTSGFTQKSRNRAEARAEAAQTQALSRNLKSSETALRKAAEGKYQALFIKNRCPNCKHREPWQNTRLFFNLSICSILPLFIGVVGLFSGNGNPPPAAWVLLAIGVMMILSRIIYVSRMNRLSAALQDVSRPHFYRSDDAEELKKATEAIQLRPEETILYDFADFPKIK